jgi:hypothetical protein
VKSLVARNTLVTLHTQEDDEDYQPYQQAVTEISPRVNKFDMSHISKANKRDASAGIQYTLGDDTRPKSQMRVGKPKMVPGLDFSQLKHVREFKDWYAYSKKLEDAVTQLN